MRGKARRGPIIAFAGINGAGKSTVANLAMLKLRRDGFRVQFEHLDRYSPPGQLLARLSRKRRGAASDDRPGGGMTVSRAIRAALTLGLIVDDLLQYWLRMRWVVRNGTVLLYDRFFLDRVVALEQKHQVSSWASGLHRRVVPGPDLGFLLSVDPQLAASRAEPDVYSPQELTLMASRYARVCAGARWISIRVEGDVDDTLANCMHALTQVL